MEKNTGGLIAVFVALSLVIGLIAGAVMFPQETVTEVITEKIVEVQAQCDATTCPELPAEQIEVLVNGDLSDYKQEAIDLCFEEFADRISVDKYQELELLKESDEWSIALNEDEMTVTVDELKLRRYDDLSDARKTWYKSCEVYYEDGEDPEVTLTTI